MPTTTMTILTCVLFGCRRTKLLRIMDSSAAAAGEVLQEPEIQAEMQFQTAKQVGNRLHEYLAGALVEGDVPPEMVQVARQVQEHWGQLDKAREAKARAMTRAMVPHWSFDGRAFIFLEHGKVEDFKGMNVTGLRSAAEVFVAKDPSAPTLSTKWIAALQGGVVADSAWVLSRGQRGVGFAYEAAIRTQRQVYISDKFSAANVVLTRPNKFNSSKFCARYVCVRVMFQIAREI